MNKVNHYTVVNFPGKPLGFWARILIKLGLKKRKGTFDIYINADYKIGEIISASNGDQYEVIKQL